MHGIYVASACIRLLLTVRMQRTAFFSAPHRIASHRIADSIRPSLSGVSISVRVCTVAFGKPAIRSTRYRDILDSGPAPRISRWTCTACEAR